LSLNFTNDLFNILHTVFPHYNINVTGVFCHQRPIINIGEKKNPEIGDILFIFSNKDTNNVERLNSLLFQAKVSNAQILRISNNDKHQLKLYKEWPEFNYCHGKLKGTTRDILPKTINDGAQYLLIDNIPLNNGLYGVPGTFPMGCAIADEVLILDNSLTEEIFNFLKFKSGRIFEPLKNNLKDDWSKMIWDLLKISRSICSNRKNVGLKDFPRVNENVFYSTSNLKFNSLYFNLHGDNEIFQEEENGISIIVIERSPMEIER
jgi:hypothetical protein